MAGLPITAAAITVTEILTDANQSRFAGGNPGEIAFL
ncbi:hypothetical protein BH10PSE10_BH10PSE10_24390 [soil metagenome]